MSEIMLRKALVSDVKPIHTMLMSLAKDGMLLPRPLGDLYRHLREFYVLERDANVVGCCALAIAWDDIAEVRSLVVDEKLRRQSLGRRLVDACLDEAKDLGLSKVFTLTYQDAFFSKMGFQEVSKDVLPNKIWADCIHCPKFPDCDEIAMLINL